MIKQTPICFLLLLLTACGGNTDDLQQWIQTSSQGLRGKIEPLPVSEAYHPFSYQAYELLDPFSSQKLALVKNQNMANAPDFNRLREPLENYELDKLKMVGTLYRSGVNYGLIRTPEGMIYRVQQGNFIGPSFGQIKQIGESAIELSETVEDTNGAWVQRSNSLPLDQQGQSK
ncbi:pilus assembly protein PilP [Neisseriaceae bacterium TC5R-5]|nr:pilus assembly protein PilP [Neisseriaceae bacterium TC5R-5]